MKIVLFAVFSFSLSFGASAQNDQDAEFPQFRETLKGFMTYRQFDKFENHITTTPYTRKSLDLSVVELTGEYKLSPRSELEFEIEFEHGGTGSAIEYDSLEEGGEFEYETEKGGEVVLSEVYYLQALGHQTFIRVGKMPVPISLGNVQNNFILYPSVLASAAEGSIIPAEWREMGVEAQKRFDSGLNVRLLLTSGLNSEFFRKNNWVGGGYQKKFETINADNLAVTFVLEYGDVATDDGIAAAIYYGDSSANRFKRNKLAVESTLLLTSLFGHWTWGQFELRGQLLRGTLSNSDKVSLANGTLGGLAKTGAYSELGHVAQLEMLEGSYKIIQGNDHFLKAFLGYEHVDPMAEVEGSILKDDRYNQVISSAGLMQTWNKIFFVKGQYARGSNALAGLPTTNEYQIAFGFDWYGYNL